MAEDQYKKISGVSSTSGQTAYLGDDHLLILNGRYKETTKKLSYKDVEAILVTPTSSSGIIALFCVSIGLIFIILALVNRDSVYLWVWLGLSLPLFYVFGYNIYSKGSVVFGVQTAVQLVIIEGINTQRRAKRASLLLAEKVESVQGSLSQESLSRAIEKTKAKEQSETDTKQNDGAGVPPELNIPELPKPNVGEDAKA